MAIPLPEPLINDPFFTLIGALVFVGLLILILYALGRLVLWVVARLRPSAPRGGERGSGRWPGDKWFWWLVMLSVGVTSLALGVAFVSWAMTAPPPICGQPIPGVSPISCAPPPLSAPVAMLTGVTLLYLGVMSTAAAVLRLRGRGPESPGAST